MAHDIDLHLGKRLRRRRRLLGLTQQQLAMSVGVRFQQIQKYECGANRISAARLWQLSQALEVPTSYFYDGIAELAQPSAANDQASGGMNGGMNVSARCFARRDARLILAYYQLANAPAGACWTRQSLNGITTRPRVPRQLVEGLPEPGAARVRLHQDLMIGAVDLDVGPWGSPL